MGLPATQATQDETLGQLKVGRIFSSVPALLMLKFFIASAWGLWNLKSWARHSVAGEYGLFALLWIRSLFFYSATAGVSRLSQDALQSIYYRIGVAGMMALTLWLYGGVAEAFGEKE